jgi:N-acetylneuraminate lyase
MRYIGLDCGKFRSPVKNMPEELYQRFVSDVKALDMASLFSLI